MVNFENDYKFGEDQENLIKNKLETKWGGLIQTGRWEKHDFINNKYNIEVKSRKCKYNSYPTTLLTCNKIVEEPNKKLYFVFNFTEEINSVYYIKYKKNLFDTFEKKLFSRVNKDFDKKLYYYIPIELLKKLD